MACKAGQFKTSTPYGIFIVTQSLEGWPTKDKEAPSPLEVRLTLLDTNPAFQYLGWKVTKILACLRVILAGRWLCKEFSKENSFIKDPIPKDLKSFLVCKFTCAGYSSSYIGKTCHHFKTSIEKHIKKDKKSHIFKHLPSTTTWFD